MTGPFPSGTFLPNMPPSMFIWENNRFVRGTTYRVIKLFVDADGHKHPSGEEWRYITGRFDRQYDLIELCVGFPSGDEWILPLKWDPKGQEEIIEHYHDYFAPIGAN